MTCPENMIQLVIIFLEVLSLFFLSKTLTRTLSEALYRTTRSQSITVQLLSLVFLPGVILHELSHMFVAGILFVPVGEIEFLPKRTEEGVKLGSVAVGKTDPVRRAIIGLAPVVAGLAVLLMIASYVPLSMIQEMKPQTIVIMLFFLYAIFAVANTMFSSPRDLEGFLEVSLAFLFFALVLYIFTIISGVRINLSFPFEQVGILVSPLLFVLSVATLIDVLAVAFLKIIRRR